MDLLEISVRFELGEIGSDQLPEIAVRLLTAGYDTPALRVVAGDSRPEMADAGKRFAEALQELGVGLTVREACLLRAEFVADAIVAGTVVPMSGANELYFLDRHFGDVPELEPFLREYWRSPLPKDASEEAARAALLREAAQALVGQLRTTVAIQQRKASGPT